MILRKIEQLDEADRGLLVAASVQGYEFESAVAAKVLRKEASGVEERLGALDRMYGFVRPVGDLEYPDKTYTLRYRFLHVLYQNALYDSLGPTRRAEMSIATAEALISFYRHQVAPVASQLAFLFETGRDYWRACEYFLIAAHNAERVFAHDEVIALTRHGLDLLRSLPETPLRARRGLDLQLTLAFALSFAKGYAAPETAREMTRTLEICREMGETAELVPVFWALWTYYIVAGNLAEARRTGEQILRIAEKTNDPVLLLAGHTGLGISLEQEGDFALAHEQLERGVALHDPGQTNRYLALYRMDPGMLCRGVSIRIFSLLGYAEKACHRAEESLQLAKRKADPSGTMLLLVFAAHLHQFLQNAEKARKFAEECMSLCNEYGNPTEEAWVTTARGWAEARDGQTEEGLQEIRKGLTAMRTIGAEIAVPLHFSVLADAARVTGRVEEGLAAVERGLAIARKNGDHFYDAELLRLRGEMLLVQSATNAEEAEACFQQAIETSRRQTAKGLELRASTSLARLWQAQGKGKEAQQLLGEIYAWFTEGFSTADLREATSLLAELS